NMYGTGDSCSAYGNRNFWRFFHDWFGSPIGGGYLLKAAGPETYLIVDDKKYLVTDSRLLAALRPLGPIGEISTAYLDSFVTTGEMTQLVSDSISGSKFLLVDGVKYSVPDCQVAGHFGANCENSIPVTSLQLNNFVDGGALSRLIKTESGARYWIEDGTSRIVIDDIALASVGAQAFSPTPMTLEQIVSIIPGAPLASESIIFKVAGSTQKAVATGGVTYLIDTSLASEVDLGKWLVPVSEEISRQAIESSLSTQSLGGFIRNLAGSTFVLTAAGKIPVTDPENWVDTAAIVSDDLLQRVPTVNGSLTAPAVVTFRGTTLNYLVESGERRVSSDPAMVARLLSLVEQDKAIQIPKSAVSAIKFAGEAFAPGSIIRTKSSSQLFFVDSLVTKIKLSGRAQATSVSKSKTFTVSNSGLASLATLAGFPSNKVQCNGEIYLLDNGTLYPISPAGAAEYPMNTYAMSSAACESMALASRPIGQFIKDPSGKLFLIQDGKKQTIPSSSAYEELKGDGPGFVTVSSYFSGRMASAGSAPKTVELASLAGTPSGNFGDLIFDPATPIPVQPPAAPTNPVTNPEPSEAPSAQPEPQPTSVTEYRVVSGDSLSAIAAKFGLSLKSLQEFNKIANANQIRVGQLIRIPTASLGDSNEVPEPAVEPVQEQDPPPVEVEYRVASGDTLMRIASKFGISSKSLQDYNSIANPNRISIGQLLRIPTSTSNTNVRQVEQEPEPVAPKTYVVTSGDTLWGISRKLNVSSSALASVNGINNANFIRVGQILKVPN
ncbi:MAG: LysM peptidoglycan-binding domain-containing protein, partial [Aquiluna sp.]|nr:LysM peptidoglycan-binding domain-containing protein [Aquiluna sp.]